MRDASSSSSKGGMSSTGSELGSSVDRSSSSMPTTDGQQKSEDAEYYKKNYSALLCSCFLKQRGISDTSSRLTQTQLDHSVDAVGVGLRIVKGEA